jgi:membrane protease YdiL (CAAX protease family)
MRARGPEPGIGKRVDAGVPGIDSPASAADTVFIAVACGVIPLVSLWVAVAAADAVAHANLTAYAASIIKWTTLGTWAVILGRRKGMTWEDLYLQLRGSFLVRRPGSAIGAALLFVMVVQLAVLPRFTAAYTALGLPTYTASYLAMPKTVFGRVLGTLTALAAAAGSEIVYRGYLRVLAERYFVQWWVAAIVVSAVFGWAHSFYGLYGTFYTALAGFAFALLARATGCLYVVILAHLLFDLLVFLRG